MKIVLIEPKSPNLHIYSKFKIPRLGCILLGTILKNCGHTVKIFIEDISQVDWEVVRQADLVGISTITSTAGRAYAIAERIRRMGIKVVMGGPHVTYLPEEACRHCDFVLCGEAEESFPLLVECLEKNENLEKVNGLVMLKERNIVRNNYNSQYVDIEKNPIPDFSLISGFRNSKTFIGETIIPVQVSRGCPHNCSFCSVTQMFGRKMRWRTIGSIMEELMRYNSKKYHIFFCDDNFAGNPVKAKELLSMMLDSGTKFTWSAQVRADVAKDRQLLEMMKATGCIAVYVGVESPDPAVLTEVNKRQKPEEVKHLLLRMKKYGISVHGMFVVGFDSDGPDCWKNIVKFAKDAQIATMQTLILTPLPGTKVFEQLEKEGRIIFRDWSLYDSHHVVFRHPTMDPETLQRCQLNAHKSFYSGRKIANDLLQFRFGDAFAALYARGIQYEWAKRNSIYMKAIKLIKPWRDIEIRLDLRVPVTAK